MVEFERSLELAVKLLHHAIGLRVVGGCMSTLGAEKSHKCTPQLGFELSTIRDYCFQKISSYVLWSHVKQML